MNAKQLLGAVAAMIIRIALAAVIIVVVFRLAVYAYDFGYQVFADIPVSRVRAGLSVLSCPRGRAAGNLPRYLSRRDWSMMQMRSTFMSVFLITRISSSPGSMS